MKTLFWSHDIWDYVETSYEENEEDEARSKEYQKRDANALFFILQAVDESIFSRIAAMMVDKGKVHAKTEDPHKDVGKLKKDGDKAMMGRLMSHKLIDRLLKRKIRLFRLRGSQILIHFRRGRGQGGYRGRICGRNNVLKCSYSNKTGHSEKFCWSKPKGANYVEEKEDDLLFMTMSAAKEEKSQVWYMDSGCSNHMSGDRLQFIAFDETGKSHVRLGDDKQLKVEGKGTVEISVGSSKKVIKEVHFTPSHAHNLLSVEKSKRAEDVLELIHADLCGSVKTESLAALVEKQSGKALKTLCTDRGGEFTSKDFDAFCDTQRKNRTVIEMARSMLRIKGMPDSFWAEAVAVAVQILNISPTKAV
nr:hypothetical protein [Tanacetum cinerariifolium]